MPCFLWYTRTVKGYNIGKLRRGHTSETRHPYHGSSKTISIVLIIAITSSKKAEECKD